MFMPQQNSQEEFFSQEKIDTKRFGFEIFDGLNVFLMFYAQQNKGVQVIWNSPFLLTSTSPSANIYI